MATRALRKAKQAEPAAPQEHAPQRWWQWFLVYPAFAIALVSAAPQWVDKAKAYAWGVRSAAESKKEALLWQTNASCVGLNSKGFLSPKNIAVDATICDSGDILVHAITPQKKEVFKWLPLDDVVPTQASGGLIGVANAATLPARLGGPALSAQVPVVKAALLQVVICTKMNGRMLLRRIQTPQGCFDELIDTYTGALISRNPAPCVPQC